MRWLLLPLAVLVFTACTRSHSGDAGLSITGTWKMVAVTDLATASATTGPTSLHSQVIISFASTSPTTGKLWGHTPTNRIDPSDYSLGFDQGITIPALQITKVAETPWGAAFADHITSAKRYSLVTGYLEITTSEKTLRFQMH